MLACVTSSSHVQYFGRSKIQFAFQILTTDHFDTYFYPRERPAAAAAQIAERRGSRLSSVLNHELSSRQPLIL